MKTAMTHYDLLGVEPDASEEDIKRAYRKIIKLHHPDVSTTGDGGAHAALLSSAYAVLMSYLDRKDYDAKLRREGLLEEEVRYSYVDEDGDGEPDSKARPSQSETENNQGRQDRQDFSARIPFEERLWSEVRGQGYSPGERIQKMTKIIIPEKFSENDPKIISGKVASWVSLGLMALAPVLSFLISIYPQQLTAAVTAVSAILSVVIFFNFKKVKNSLALPWWGVTTGFATLLGGLFALTLIPMDEKLLLLAQFSVAPIFAALASGTFWKFRSKSRFLKPKALRDNNSFGQVSEIHVENLLEDILNPFWGVKGVKVYRTPHESFSHMVVFGNRVVLLKAVDMLPGSLSIFEGAVFNRSGPVRIDKLVDNDYLSGLVMYASGISTKIEVIPMVVAFPAKNLLSFTPDKSVTFVAGDDAAALIAKVLFHENAENVVDHALVVDMFEAIHN